MQPSIPPCQSCQAEFPFFLEPTLGILGFLLLICLL